MVDLFIATSINSKIFLDNNPLIFGKLSSKKLLEVRNNIRNEYETIIVGGNTIKKDNPTLLNTNKSNIRIIVDKYADLDINSKIFTTMPERTNIILLKKNDKYKEKLLSIGVNVIYLESIEEKEIIKTIKKIAIGKILVEGGSKTICMFLKNNFINNIRIIQFPIIFPQDALSFEKFNNLIINCKLKESFIIDNKYIYECYKIDKNK